MAWRSSGTTNDELVNNLKRFEVITSMEVEEGFRSVDRKFFVPRNVQHLAHADRPQKEGNIHISAPHIYGTVLEALDLRRNSPITFLNAGSGTGYLTCIAASILGPRSSHYCVEIQEDVVAHCKESIAAWKANFPPGRDIRQIEVVRGNALTLDVEKGECALGFDRIYIGAAIDRDSLPQFKKMLKPGGILVGPVEDELVKIVRSPLSSQGLHEFTRHDLSPVRFAPLVEYPRVETVIPAQVWSPSMHQYYPDSFQKSCETLMLCSHANYTQPVVPQPMERTNVASTLPRAVWMEILSYTHRDWFETPKSEAELLRQRLADVEANFERANQARQEAEARCHLAEKERDVYRLLARRWKARLGTVMGESDDEDAGEMESIEEAAAAAMLLGGRTSVSFLGLGSMLHRFGSHGVTFQEEEDSEDDDDDDSGSFHHNGNDRMDEDEVDVSDNTRRDNADEREESDDETMPVAPTQGQAHAAAVSNELVPISDQRNTMEIVARPKMRTVSVSSEDVTVTTASLSSEDFTF